MPLRFLSSLIWSQRRIALWLAAILIVFVSVFFIKRDDISNYLTRYEDRNRLRDEVELLQFETRQLEKKREILEKGGYEVEKVAREQFRMSRPGEHVLYLISPNDGVSTEPAPTGRLADDRVSTSTLRTRRSPPSPAVP